MGVYSVADDGIWKKDVYGKWYVFQTYTGREAETVALCESRIKKDGERICESKFTQCP
jgi:hypothetical protein